MAIDTAAKRKSAINIGSPWRSTLPLPDGTITQADRQTTAFMYSGILATVATIAEAPEVVLKIQGWGLTFEPEA